MWAVCLSGGRREPDAAPCTKLGETRRSRSQTLDCNSGGVDSIATARLLLEPLLPSAAAEMVDLLADADLYTFTGGKPPTCDELEVRYQAQVTGPTRADEQWRNWIVRQFVDRRAVGYVQATIADNVADVAWVIGVAHQGQGLAREAAAGMGGWLVSRGVQTITAHIHPDHVASRRVAAAIGLVPSGVIADDGEMIWTSTAQALRR